MFFRGASQPAFPRRYHFTALQTRDRSQTIDCGSQGPSALLLPQSPQDLAHSLARYNRRLRVVFVGWVVSRWARGRKGK